MGLGKTRMEGRTEGSMVDKELAFIQVPEEGWVHLNLSNFINAACRHCAKSLTSLQADTK